MRPKTRSPLWKWTGRSYSLTNRRLSLRRKTHRGAGGRFPHKAEGKAGKTGRRPGRDSGSCGGTFHDG